MNVRPLRAEGPVAGEEYLTVAEVAALLRTTARTVRDWCRAGKLESFVVEGRVLVPRSAVEEKIAAGRRPGRQES